jgi:hypothetical protein
MHPAVSDHLVQAHITDLRRRAQANRLARSARSARRARSDPHRQAGSGWPALSGRVLALLGGRSTRLPSRPPLAGYPHSGAGAGSAPSRLAAVRRPLRTVGRLVRVGAGLSAHWR